MTSRAPHLQCRPSLGRGNSSVGRAQPCQGWGREFESRFPLQNFSFKIKIKGWTLRLTHEGLRRALSPFAHGALPESNRSHARVVQFCSTSAASLSRRRGDADCRRFHWERPCLSLLPIKIMAALGRRRPHPAGAAVVTAIPRCQAGLCVSSEPRPSHRRGGDRPHFHGSMWRLMDLGPRRYSWVHSPSGE